MFPDTLLGYLVVKRVFKVSWGENDVGNLSNMTVDIPIAQWWDFREFDALRNSLPGGFIRYVIGWSEDGVLALALKCDIPIFR